MSVSVVYWSGTGNTQTMAEAVAKGIEEAGGQAVGGLDMLIYQGIIAFELWNPGVIVTEKMVDTVRQMMTERLNNR